MKPIADITPGRIVEHDGDLYMIELVEVEITMQRLDSHAERIAMLYNGESAHSEVVCPVFTRIRGQLGEGILAPARFKLLYKEEEL